MKIFIIGLPKSGRTTVAKTIATNLGYVYLSASDCINKLFRKINSEEHEQSYKEEYDKFYATSLMENPNICIDNINHSVCNKDNNFVIDGISSPRDFINLFEFGKDIVVILNRTDNSSYHQDHDNIFISTIKDYCFWMAAVGFLKKEKWIEYNFKVNGEDSDYIRTLGNKNSVYIIRNINRVISHLENNIRGLIELS